MHRLRLVSPPYMKVTSVIQKLSGRMFPSYTRVRSQRASNTLEDSPPVILSCGFRLAVLASRTSPSQGYSGAAARARQSACGVPDSQSPRGHRSAKRNAPREGGHGRHGALHANTPLTRAGDMPAQHASRALPRLAARRRPSPSSTGCGPFSLSFRRHT